MDTERIDRIATILADTQPRRSVFRLFGAVALGATGLAALGGEDVAAKRMKPGKGKGNGNGNGNKPRPRPQPSAPRDMCPTSAPAPNSPTCGTSALGEACTCTWAVEGNNICVNFIESCAALVPCQSTAECREAVGFHFFCQAAGSGSCGQVCVPECDNTTPSTPEA